MSTPTSPADPQRLYDRSRASGFDLLKTLVSLSTAAVGAFFLALTRRIEPPLSPNEFCFLLGALIFMVLAVFTGLIGWGADAKYYDYWANSLDNQRSNSANATSKAERFNAVRRFSIIAMASLFTLGMVASAVYLVLRMSRTE
jgi:hypothetical protein